MLTPKQDIWQFTYPTPVSMCICIFKTRAPWNGWGREGGRGWRSYNRKCEKRARDKHLSLGEGSRYLYQNSSDSSSSQPWPITSLKSYRGALNSVFLPTSSWQLRKLTALDIIWRNLIIFPYNLSFWYRILDFKLWF